MLDIAKRYVPPVAGRDLEQALTYVSEQGFELSWFYTSFTYPRTFYRKGSRPLLEEALAKYVDAKATDRQRLEQCVTALVCAVTHFSKINFKGPMDRGLSEEDVIRSRQGWCAEQVRVFVAFTQIAGLPSRIVLAANKKGHGHVLAEVFVGGKWGLVDQTEGFIFTGADGGPLNVLDVRSDRQLWLAADRLYKARLMAHRAQAADSAFWDQWVPYGVEEHPLEILDQVGYCNYFIH